MILKKIKMNKKGGGFTGIILMIAMVFALAIALIIFARVFLLITSELKDTDKFSDMAVDKIEMVEDNTIPLLDFFIFFSLISLMIGLIISSLYIHIHPVVTVVFLIALIIAIFMAGQITNIYTEITENSALASTASEFTYTNLILGDHFPMIVLVMAIIIVIILFSKSKNVGAV